MHGPEKYEETDLILAKKDVHFFLHLHWCLEISANRV